jgi:hypothetical protein
MRIVSSGKVALVLPHMISIASEKTRERSRIICQGVVRETVPHQFAERRAAVK